MESRIVSLLKADAAVAAIVSERIYPLVIPKSGAKPAIVYSRISDSRHKQYQEVTSLQTARIQIDCWSETFTEARALALAVNSLLDGYAGIVTGMKIQAIWKESQLDRHEDETNVFGVSIDFKIQFTQ